MAEFKRGPIFISLAAGGKIIDKSPDKIGSKI